MHKEAKLVAQLRTEEGTRACRRLRWQGLVPGNLYGHNQPNQSITIPADELMPVVQAGIKVADLELNSKVDKVLVRQVQFDAFGDELIHFDLLRVDPNERVHVDVPVELKGTAPGVLSGGVLEQPIHKIAIDCLAYQIPDSIQVRVGNLQLGGAIHVRDLELPEGSTCKLPGDSIVVHVIQVHTHLPETTAAASGEPEVIGKKPAEGADEKPAAGKK